MDTCFVIQPFDDGGPFDKRFDDVLKPAIEAAGLEAYRVDRDPHADVPIDQIHAKIREAAACVADITTDNPNVWYELGYAFAAGKDVVMTCAKSRVRFPFDIQHRTIVRYTTDSSSDFDRLGREITTRLQAALTKQEEITTAATVSSTVHVTGWSQMEVVCLVIATEGTDGNGDHISAHQLANDMGKAGYTKIATRLAADRLVRRGMLAPFADSDYNGNSFTSYSVTDAGMTWLDQNEDQLQLRVSPRRRVDPRTTDESEDDIPF